MTAGFRTWLLILTGMGLCACGPYRDGPGEPVNPRMIRDAVPRDEPPSKRGNPESYVVLGKRYFVLPSSRGYVERGIASWYGKKFHGRDTSNGERYNMYAMTAAHKTLPLPTYVEVTNLRNGRKAVVRVNDRGPFHSNRLIDLSYSAAQKLGMLKTGTTLVEVRALGADGEPTAPSPARAGDGRDWRDESHLSNRIYIQVGAFSVRYNAERLLSRLQGARLPNVRIQESAESSTPLHRVRIGPLSSVAATDKAVARLEALGLDEYQVVVE